MSYTIYKTEGILIKKTIVGEASAICRILTKEHGVISVRAESGVKSRKMSPALQLGTYAFYDIIEGKSGYKLVGVNVFDIVSALEFTADQIDVLRNCYEYTLRLVPDDDMVDEEVYQLIMNVSQYIRNSRHVQNIYDSFRYKLLLQLGYIASEVAVNTIEQLHQAILDAENASGL